MERAADGTLIDAGSIPAANMPQIAPGDSWDSGGTWVRAVFSQPRTLVSGATYNFRLSTTEDTEYNIVPVREGTDSGDAGGERLHRLPVAPVH